MIVLKNVLQLLKILGKGIFYSSVTLLMLFIVFTIILRAFGGVVEGSYDLINVLIAVAVPLSLVFTQIYGHHLEMPFLPQLLKGKIKLFLLTIVHLLKIGIVGILSYASLLYAQEMLIKGEECFSIAIPLAPFRFFWGISTSILCLVFLIDLVRLYRHQEA